MMSRRTLQRLVVVRHRGAAERVRQCLFEGQSEVQRSIGFKRQRAALVRPPAIVGRDVWPISSSSSSSWFSSSSLPPKDDRNTRSNRVTPDSFSDSNNPDDKKSTTNREPDHDHHDTSPPVEENANSATLWKHWRRQLASPPNILTISRIFSAPLLSYLIISHQYQYAVFGCLLAGASDVLDGYLAKNHNMNTVLGTYLDPFADKVIINTLSISLWYDGLLPTPLVLLWMTRDVGLIAACYVLARSHTKSHQYVLDPVTVPLKVEPTTISKINTGFQFLTISTALLLPVYPEVIHQDVLTALCWITGGTTLASAWSYVGGAALTKSGNEIRERVKQRAKLEGEKIKELTKLEGEKIKRTVQKTMEQTRRAKRARKK